jgi:hypothetical protein
VTDRPEGLWVRMIFHVAEIFETFFFIAVAIHEVVFVDFEDMSEKAKEGQEDVVVDKLNPYILASPSKFGTGHEHD